MWNSGKTFVSLTIMGNLGADPELKYTPSGRAVVCLSIATQRSYKKEDGEYQNITAWHRVVCWGKLAESVAKTTHKGSRILVERAYLDYRSYTDKDGIKRYITEIVAEAVQNMDKRDVSENRDADFENHTDQPPAANSSSPGDGYPDSEPDDLPF